MSRGKIFISYRRADASGFAGRLFDYLSTRFGEENIFMDVEALDLGVDFHKALDQAVSACDVLLAVIGNQWLNIKDELGQRRLDDPKDFVRIEIGAALSRNINVIPILVQGARMPKKKELPKALKRLSRYNGMEIRHERFNADADRLVRGIAAHLPEYIEPREYSAVANIKKNYRKNSADLLEKGQLSRVLRVFIDNEEYILRFIYQLDRFSHYARVWIDDVEVLNQKIRYKYKGSSFSWPGTNWPVEIKAKVLAKPGFLKYINYIDTFRLEVGGQVLYKESK